jgi:hypothetical protein
MNDNELIPPPEPKFLLYRVMVQKIGVGPWCSTIDEAMQFGDGKIQQKSFTKPEIDNMAEWDGF